MTTTIDYFRYARNVLNFSAGSTIFAEGQPGDVMYIILDGQVEVQHGAHSIALCGVGEVLGELALIDCGVRSAAAIAHTDCRLAPINAHEFTLLVQQHPYFALQVMHVLVERLRLARMANAATDMALSAGYAANG